jgi:tetratricopeptide (TPR) repeat protein
MPELFAFLVLGLAAAAAVALPFARRPPPAAPTTDIDELELRHRVALDGLRDVEADRRAGSLDEASHAAARAEAEAIAAATLHELDAARSVPPPIAAPARSAARPLAFGGAALAVAVVVGLLLPPPIGLANRTLDPRRDRIEDALVRFDANERDPQAISDLADAYLAGETLPDLQRAQAALLLLINLQPANASAYARLATAQLRAGDLDGADATLDEMDTVAGDSPDLPFLRGLVARERGNDDEARAQFERFLEVAPADPRAPMIRALLDEG